MSAKMMRFAYKDKMLQTNGDPNHPIVKVFNVSCFLYPLFVTTSLDEAMRWVDNAS
jgi:hypothetical protein